MSVVIILNRHRLFTPGQIDRVGEAVEFDLKMRSQSLRAILGDDTKVILLYRRNWRHCSSDAYLVSSSYPIASKLGNAALSNDAQSRWFHVAKQATLCCSTEIALVCQRQRFKSCERANQFLQSRRG